MNETLIKQIIEAALMVAGQPLTLGQLHALFDEDEKPEKSAILAIIETINTECETRGIEVSEVASGYRFQVKQDIFPYISRMWEEKPQKYSRALLETLALIAYRQPITRGEIEEVRGVSVSTNIIRTLEERDWIRVVGHRDVPGKPALFGTTKEFLDYFNLKSLDQLPTLAELKDIDELEPELDLANQESLDSEETVTKESSEATSETESQQAAENTKPSTEPPIETDDDTNAKIMTDAEQAPTDPSSSSNDDDVDTHQGSEIEMQHDNSPNDEAQLDAEIQHQATEQNMAEQKEESEQQVTDLFADLDDLEEEDDEELAEDLDSIMAAVDQVLDTTASTQAVNIDQNTGIQFAEPEPEPEPEPEDKAKTETESKGEENTPIQDQERIITNLDDSASITSERQNDTENAEQKASNSANDTGNENA